MQVPSWVSRHIFISIKLFENVDSYTLQGIIDQAKEKLGDLPLEVLLNGIRFDVEYYYENTNINVYFDRLETDEERDFRVKNWIDRERKEEARKRKARADKKLKEQAMLDNVLEELIKKHPERVRELLDASVPKKEKK
jgi:hypothetical protein